MILAIHLRAPTFSSMILLGTSEQKISEEEYSSRISISRRRNSEILVHCECSDTDIDTVKERYKVGAGS